MIQKPKGTYDVYGEYGKKILYLQNLWQLLMERYNYEYVRTPTFEATEVFVRGVGNGSDIVNKETYDFVDRGERKMTLRPEGTAAVARCFIENKMMNDPRAPIKLWYYTPMFRYERPQSGRFREHYQFGVEVFKGESPLIDAEVISIAVNFLTLLGLHEVKVNINTLGDEEVNQNYNQALTDYLNENYDKLSSESKRRLKINPLRVLDSKEAADQVIIANSPKLSDYLNEASKKFYEDLKTYLTELGIAYQEKPTLVRGLDYYTHTVFEVEANISGFGSQNVLCGGGRYDGLVAALGGPAVKGIGFGMGIERLISALEHEGITLTMPSLDVYIMPLTTEQSAYAYRLANDLRLHGFNVEFDLMNRTVKNNFKNSERLGAKYVILIGEDEIANGELTIKNNRDKTEYKITEEAVINFLEEKLGDEDVEV